MLYSFYTAEGIVYAADSRITHRGAHAPLAAQTKVLPIPGLGESSGVIGYFGLAQVGGEPMDGWLRDVIAKYPAARDADSFARYLVVRVEGEATPAELAEVSGFHLGTFEQRDGHVVPTFTFIRNAHDFDNGSYSNVGRFIMEEQLLGRDLHRQAIPMAKVRDVLRAHELTNGTPYWYRNGDVTNFGPIAFLLETALRGLVAQKGSGFRAPTTLDGWRRLARTLIASTGNLYGVYYAGAAAPVGGGVVVEAIPWP